MLQNLLLTTPVTWLNLMASDWFRMRLPFWGVWSVSHIWLQQHLQGGRWGMGGRREVVFGVTAQYSRFGSIYNLDILMFNRLTATLAVDSGWSRRLAHRKHSTIVFNKWQNKWMALKTNKQWRWQQILGLNHTYWIRIPGMRHSEMYLQVLHGWILSGVWGAPCQRAEISKLSFFNVLKILFWSIVD